MLRGEVAPTPLAVGDVMLALGDSIAAGIGAPHASEGCMAVLAARLRPLEPALRLVNLAVPGESSDSLVGDGGQLERAEAVISAAAAAGKRIGPLTLSVGGNDILEAALHGDDEALRRLDANLAVILDRLGAALDATGVDLVEVACVQTVYNPFEGLRDGRGPTADELAPRRAARGGFNRVIRATAARTGVRLADVAGAFRGRAAELTWVGSGDIHPTASGHGVIARTYLDAGGWELP
jgi:lysophospholipase L1-like esterase